ncbi:hypothetical protein QR680_012697 [Steinernema hermaphroditum]|uniref:Uncharacterized protein n=1 Tax=Steinernema hermaphroditum TaxID=289476 RepID=A0AA39M163_9BILA|nr:hypothetical protein QR680_012697 [Steinernema hermaphroditum]
MGYCVLVAMTIRKAGFVMGGWFQILSILLLAPLALGKESDRFWGFQREIGGHLKNFPGLPPRAARRIPLSYPPVGIFNTNFAPPFATSLLALSGFAMENVPMPNGIGMAPGGFMTPGMNFEDSRFVALMNRANTFPLAHSPPRPAHGGLADGWTDWSSWSLCSPIAGGMPVRTRACLQNDVLRPPALQTVLGGGWAYSKKVGLPLPPKKKVGLKVIVN